MDKIYKDNHSYWLQRAKGYSEVNQEELAGVQNHNWTSFLTKQITSVFPDRNPGEINVLDVGSGPGFISIILAKAGYKVTAIDFAETMIQEAKTNAADMADSINFIQGDAMELPFDKDSFDVVFSRNLIWNIPFPERAYDNWVRVLKPGGLMMVFDANWYSYLVDETKMEEYNNDRANVAAEGLGDYNIGENFDQMEAIAGDLPSTRRIRPQWDKDYLENLGVGTVDTRDDVGQFLYSEKEKINYKSTPLFMVRLIKNK